MLAQRLSLFTDSALGNLFPPTPTPTCPVFRENLYIFSSEHLTLSEVIVIFISLLVYPESLSYERLRLHDLGHSRFSINIGYMTLWTYKLKRIVYIKFHEVRIFAQVSLTCSLKVGRPCEPLRTPKWCKAKKQSPLRGSQNPIWGSFD